MSLWISTTRYNLIYNFHFIVTWSFTRRVWCLNTKSALFFLCTDDAVGKRLLYSVPALVCAISLVSSWFVFFVFVFFAFPIAAIVLQHPFTSLKDWWVTIVLIVGNSSSWVLMNVWMKLNECHMVFTVLFCFFFFLTFLYELFIFEQHKLGQEFIVALMEKLQCTQLPSETAAAALRLVHRSDLWTFTCGWFVKSQYCSPNQGV